MTQTLTPMPAAAAEVERARMYIRRSHERVLNAIAHMPRMTVDWFGPASEAWRVHAEDLRKRIQNIELEVHRASDLTWEIDP